MSQLIKLPSVALSERSRLPAEAGIYFVLDAFNVLYIGQTTDLMNRWKNHHQQEHVKDGKHVRIYFLTTPAEELLERERQMIRQFRPRFNGTAPKREMLAAEEPRTIEPASSPEVRLHVSRYFDLLRKELRRVHLERNEIMFLLSCRPIEKSVSCLMPLLTCAIQEASSALAEKWGVDGPALVIKLKALTPGQAFAVVDALERAWKIGGDLEAAARAVGLLRGA